MAKARRSGEWTVVPAFNGPHTRQPKARTRYQPFRLTIPDDPAQTNILIDHNFRPRLTDYGLTAIISDPSVVHSDSTTSPSVGTVQYMAPELLNPSGSGLEVTFLMKENDIYAFGMVTYEVRKPCFASGVVSKGSMHADNHRTATVPWYQGQDNNPQRHCWGATEPPARF